MKKVAKFSKVSLERFITDCTKAFGTTPINIDKIYKDINLPTRASVGSAGYDFFTPFDVILEPGQTIIIPTGIRCEMEEFVFLGIYPRSGLGFKYRLQLDNTTGIIDSDYSFSDNEGHIMLKITNDTHDEKTIVVNKGNGIAQGIFQEYFVTIDDETTKIRNGGLGSSDKK